eukprot:Skav204523  [mRNA]  locus=scaffold3201:413139:413603:+ [translate_table: standard]
MKGSWFDYSSSSDSSLIDLDGLSKNFDKLKALLSESLQQFEIPYVIAIGNTSSGRSTLMRRWSHLPFFPSQEEICTKMPVKVEIRKPSKDDATGAYAVMSLHKYDERNNIYSDTPRTTARHIKLEDATKAVHAEMEKLCSGLDRGGAIVMDTEL